MKSSRTLTAYGAGWLSAYLVALGVAKALFAVPNSTDNLPQWATWVLPVALGVCLVWLLYLVPRSVVATLPASRLICFAAGVAVFGLSIALAFVNGQRASLYVFVTLVAVSPVVGVFLVAAISRLRARKT